MMKKIIATILMGALIMSTLSGCGNSSQENAEIAAQTEETSDEEAEEIADKEPEKEDSTPYYEEGRACLYGPDGKEIDLEAAYTNFEKALELGKTEANFYLGVLYYCYNYPEKDDQKAKTYFEAAGDDPYAQILLGQQYYFGKGVDENKAKGRELIDAVIAQGYTEGYIGSGDIAKDKEDYSTALECYNNASESEEPLFAAMAMNQIGYLYECGFGVEQDYAAAMEWYEKSADLGNSTAIYNIGYLYYYGFGVEQDYAVAMEWFKKSADLGYSDAMSHIGTLYDCGYGVEQDYEAAMEWYEKAADLGNSDAMSYIGVMYVIGDGVEEDYAAAMEWFKKAADLGNSDAMEVIGFLYEEGLGVEQDLAKAQEWYEKAGVPEKAEAAKKAAASSGGSSNDTGFIPQTYVGPNGTFVANTEEEMVEAMAKAMGAEIVTIEGDGETGGGSLAGLGVGAEVNSQ